MSHRYVSGVLRNDWNDPLDFRSLDDVIFELVWVIKRSILSFPVCITKKMLVQVITWFAIWNLEQISTSKFFQRLTKLHEPAGLKKGSTSTITCQHLWSAICFKIMTRYTCGFFPRILAIIPATRYTCVFLPRILAFFPALWGFYSQVYDHFLTNAHIYAHKKAHIYVLQTSMWYMRSQKVVV